MSKEKEMEQKIDEIFDKLKIIAEKTFEDYPNNKPSKKTTKKD